MITSISKKDTLKGPEVDVWDAKMIGVVFNLCLDNITNTRCGRGPAKSQIYVSMKRSLQDK